jgi:hypothetical protein
LQHVVGPADQQIEHPHDGDVPVLHHAHATLAKTMDGLGTLEWRQAVGRGGNVRALPHQPAADRRTGRDANVENTAERLGRGVGRRGHGGRAHAATFPPTMQRS